MISESLLRALIHPRPHEPDLFLGQRGDFGFVVFRRHPMIFLADIGNAENQAALGAVAGFDDFAFLRALERGFEGGELQARLGLLVAVAFDASHIKNRFDVGGKGNVRLCGRGGKFAFVRRGRKAQRDCCDGCQG